jgi:HAE1 family hydrophobic/amphiphilic exporter-1
MRVMGFTLNNMTLLGITLAVGIVIDDAIVVLENIFRYIEEKNVTPYEAAIQGTREVALAVMATTLSLVVIFLPIAFMNGYAKRFINPFGWTMAFSILVSMLVSFTLTPMLSSRFLKLSDALADHKTKEHGIFHWMDQFYSRQVHWALDIQGSSSRCSVVTFLLTFPLNRMVGRDFVPNEDMGEWTVHMDSPEGTALEGTEELAFRVLKDLQGIDGVAEIEPIVNPAAAARPAAAAADRRRTSISTSRRRRPRTVSVRRARIIREVRQRLSKYPANRPSISARNALGSGEGRAASPFRRTSWPRSASADRGVDASPRRRAAYAEPHRAEVEPQRLQPGDSRRRRPPARGRSRRADGHHRQHAAARGRRRRSHLVLQGRAGAVPGQGARAREPAARRRGNRRLTVPSATGPVRIDNIAKIERGLGPSALQRSNRQFTVHAHRRHRAGTRAGRGVQRRPEDDRRPEHAGDMSFRMQGQSKILDETTANMIMAIGLAMIFVYMVLASQFESFIQPIVIMLVLPIAVPFALFTLWATGRTLNLWSALGMLLLLGIVKKNSILQVDYANTLRAEGHAAARGDRRGLPHPAAADSDDDLRDHRRPDSDGARPRHRRRRPRGDRGHRHRRPVALPVPDAAARAGRVREVRRARADVAEQAVAQICWRRSRRRGG